MATIEDVKHALSHFPRAFDEDIKHALICFPDKAFSIKIVEVPMREIREQDEAKVKWEHDGWVWCESSGVYYFRNDTEKEVLYIGKAGKFGTRIKERISDEDEEWQKDISDPTTVVGFIPADDLEAYLIGELGTKYNTQHNR